MDQAGIKIVVKKKEDIEQLVKKIQSSGIKLSDVETYDYRRDSIDAISPHFWKKTIKATIWGAVIGIIVAVIISFSLNQTFILEEINIGLFGFVIILSIISALTFSIFSMHLAAVSEETEVDITETNIKKRKFILSFHYPLEKREALINLIKRFTDAYIVEY